MVLKSLKNTECFYYQDHHHSDDDLNHQKHSTLFFKLLKTFYLIFKHTVEYDGIRILI